MLPQGERVYFFAVDPGDAANPIYWMDSLTSILAVTVSAALVIGSMVSTIQKPNDFAVFMVFLAIQTIALVAALVVSIRRKSKRFIVILGDQEVWHTRDSRAMGKMRFSEIRSIRRGNRIGLAIIVVRALNQCDIPCTIERFDELVAALEKHHVLRPMSWLSWFGSDLVYGVCLMTLFLLSVPSLWGLANWGTVDKLVCLVGYYAVVSFVAGYMTWMPVRVLEFRRMAMSVAPWAMLFAIAVYRLVKLH